MTTLLYRGHDYVQHKQPQKTQRPVKLTYRQSTYTSAIDNLKSNSMIELTYRGIRFGFYY